MHLITPYALKQQLPVHDFIDQSRNICQQLFLGRDPRLVIVMGPCSIHNPDSAIAYAEKLKKLQAQVSDHAYLIMRVYGEKPRSIHGWKGLSYDPDLNGSHDMNKGLFLMRKLLAALAALEVPAATEFVEPLFAPYFDDLISWGFIGARTTASQPHRELASSFSFPIGFKNGVDGNIDIATQAVIAARQSHFFPTIDQEAKLKRAMSHGNPLTHIVLRGSLQEPNFDADTVASILKKFPERLMIDCAHGNAQKDHTKQVIAFESVLEQISSGNHHIMGVMLESHLLGGSQPLPPLSSDISITDSCIDWTMTENLIYRICEISYQKK